MDLSSVGYIVWGSACLVACTILQITCRRLRCHCGFIAKSFSGYLSFQVVSSSLWLARNFVRLGDSSSSWLEWAFWQVLLFAGVCYVSIGVAVVVVLFVKEGERSLTVIWRGLVLGLIALLAASMVCLTLQLAGNTSVLPIIVFSYYFPAASVALFGVICVWWFDWSVDEEATNKRNMKRLSVFAASVGMIDFLLPAFEYRGLPLWESTFMTRVFDSVVYLPGILPWIIWMDGQCLAYLSCQDTLHPLGSCDSTS